MLSVTYQPFMLSAIIQKVVMLFVIMLSVVMQSDLAHKELHDKKTVAHTHIGQINISE